METKPSLAPGDARRNVELKARCASLADARSTAERLGARLLGELQQRDTYFHCREGRLKLREIDGQTAQLISYERPNEATSRSSHYRLVPIEHPHALSAALTDTLGVRTVVEKSRVVYLYRNVRIHLDTVRGLGTFLEFEAVLDANHDAAEGHRLVDQLQREFTIRPEDLLTHSYSDMLSDAKVDS
jgi:predicted adenylyl cyclase CyaB